MTKNQIEIKNKMHVSTFSVTALHDFLDFMTQSKGKLYMMKIQTSCLNIVSGLVDLYRKNSRSEYTPLLDFYFYSNEFVILNRLPQFQNRLHQFQNSNFLSDSEKWAIVPAFYTLGSPFDFAKSKNAVLGSIFNFNAFKNYYALLVA
jgi:hypothetical protein